MKQLEEECKRSGESNAGKTALLPVNDSTDNACQGGGNAASRSSESPHQ